MIFIGIMLCLLSIFVIAIRLWFIVTGEVVEGQIVGHTYGARSLYGAQGYNYRIALTYQGETYQVTSVDSVVTFGDGVPKKNLGLYVNVYFKPKSKRVAIKGFHKIEGIAGIVF